VDGFKCAAALTIIGFDAGRKAQRTGEALLARARALFKTLGYPDFTETRIEALGSENAYYGPHARNADVREAVAYIAVAHPRKEALELFRRELAAAGTSWSPGTTGGGGRPNVSPAIKQFAFLLDKSQLEPRILVDGVTQCVAQPPGGAFSPAEPLAESALEVTWRDPILSGVPLIAVAYGRSGDKGDTSNIGIMARRPEYLPLIAAQVTSDSVGAYLAHLVKGPVMRHYLPGIDAFNFVCERALGGGGMASLRNDPLGKSMAQILLSMPVRVPRDMLN
jgi:hypothetical protein